MGNCKSHRTLTVFKGGAAVDTHFFAQKRTLDMARVLAAHPQLLGLGLDQGAAVSVRADRLEVVGKSRVAGYDRRKPAERGRPDHEELSGGAAYDLVARKWAGSK